MCGFCDIENKEKKPDILSEEEEGNLILGVFLGHWTKRFLPIDLYLKTARYLQSGMFKGYGKKENIDIPQQDELMLKDLKQNVYFFSGAKTYQQVKALNDELFDSKGNRVLFSKYKKNAQQIVKDYNVNYLQAEYQDAIAQSRMAAKWQSIQSTKEDLPYLQYKTAGDLRVRPAHKALNNIIRRVDDKFWDSYYPPNGWRCRCTVIQLEEGKETDLTGFKQPEDVPDDFLMNSGKDKIIFPKSHPYFKVTRDDREFARRNFDLPLPE